MNQVAADFLIRCFAPDETIAILLRREKPASTMQRIVSLERVLAPIVIVSFGCRDFSITSTIPLTL